MWIVRLALRRPYTFVVMALLIVHARRGRDHPHADRHLSRRSTSRSSRVDLVTYSGLPPKEMERRIVTIASAS